MHELMSHHNTMTHSRHQNHSSGATTTHTASAELSSSTTTTPHHSSSSSQQQHPHHSNSNNTTNSNHQQQQQQHHHQCPTAIFFHLLSKYKFTRALSLLENCGTASPSAASSASSTSRSHHAIPKNSSSIVGENLSGNAALHNSSSRAVSSSTVTVVSGRSGELSNNNAASRRHKRTHSNSSSATQSSHSSASASTSSDAFSSSSASLKSHFDLFKNLLLSEEMYVDVRFGHGASNQKKDRNASSNRIWNSNSAGAFHSSPRASSNATFSNSAKSQTHASKSTHEQHSDGSASSSSSVPNSDSRKRRLSSSSSQSQSSATREGDKQEKRKSVGGFSSLFRIFGGKKSSGLSPGAGTPNSRRADTTSSSSSPQRSQSSGSFPSTTIERYYEYCISYLRELSHFLPEHDLLHSKQVSLSRELSQGLYRYIQLRLEMVAFYRMLSSSQGGLPNFRSYCLVIRNFHQKYLHRSKINIHPFLQRIFFNAKMELDLLLNLMEEADLIGCLQYVPSTMKLFQIEKSFNRWLQRYNAPPDWVQSSPGGNTTPTSHSSSTSLHHYPSSSHHDPNMDPIHEPAASGGSTGSGPASILRRVGTSTKDSLQSLIKDKLGGSAGNLASSLVNGTIPLSSSGNVYSVGSPDIDSVGSVGSDTVRVMQDHPSPPSASSSSPASFGADVPSPSAVAGGFSPSHSVNSFSSLNNSSSAIVPTPSPTASSTLAKKASFLETTNLFKWLKLTYKFCLSKYAWYFFDILKRKQSHSNVMHHLVSNRAAVSYTDWLANFCKQISPEFVCLIYNAQDDQNHIPPVKESGYSMYHMCERGYSSEPVTGMKQWPCIYTYPVEANKEVLMRRHWPSLLSLIHEKNEVIGSRLNPLSFVDHKANKTYFFSRIDERVYLCFVYDQVVEPKSKVYKLNMEFIFQVNLYARFGKLFSYLTAG